MTAKKPRRLLSSGEVAELLGISPEGLKTRRKRGSPGLPEPDVQVGPRGGKGTVYGWEPGRPDLTPRGHPDDPALLGADPSSLPDDFVIGVRMWAALDGTTPAHVHNQRSAARRRRAQKAAKPWDMPKEDFAEGNSPRWRMSTRRAWEKAQEALREAHPGVYARARARKDGRS